MEDVDVHLLVDSGTRSIGYLREDSTREGSDPYIVNAVSLPSKSLPTNPLCQWSRA